VEVDPKEEAILHEFSTGARSIGSSGPATDQWPLHGSAAIPFAANPRWSKRYSMQKIFSPLLPPSRQEMGDSKYSGPVLLQNSFENSSAPFQVQIA